MYFLLGPLQGVKCLASMTDASPGHALAVLQLGNWLGNYCTFSKSSWARRLQGGTNDEKKIILFQSANTSFSRRLGSWFTVMRVNALQTLKDCESCALSAWTFQPSRGSGVRRLLSNRTSPGLPRTLSCTLHFS